MIQVNTQHPLVKHRPHLTGTDQDVHDPHKGKGGEAFLPERKDVVKPPSTLSFALAGSKPEQMNNRPMSKVYTDLVDGVDGSGPVRGLEFKGQSYGVVNSLAGKDKALELKMQDGTWLSIQPQDDMLVARVQTSPSSAERTDISDMTFGEFTEKFDLITPEIVYSPIPLAESPTFIGVAHGDGEFIADVPEEALDAAHMAIYGKKNLNDRSVALYDRTVQGQAKVAELIVSSEDWEISQAKADKMYQDDFKAKKRSLDALWEKHLGVKSTDGFDEEGNPTWMRAFQRQEVPGQRHLRETGRRGALGDEFDEFIVDDFEEQVYPLNEYNLDRFGGEYGGLVNVTLGERASIGMLIASEQTSPEKLRWRADRIQEASRIEFEQIEGEVWGYAGENSTMGGENVIKEVANLIQSDPSGEEFVQGVRDRWATSATHPVSMAVQEAVARRFDAHFDTDHVMSAAAEDGVILYDTFPEAFNAYVDSVYSVTQANLKSLGVTHVPLARGTGFAVSDFERGEFPEDFGASWHEVTADMQPLSSWTTDTRTASSFVPYQGSQEVDIVAAVKASVPIDHVWGMSVDGFGSLKEAEVIVIGGLDVSVKIRGATTTPEAQDKNFNSIKRQADFWKRKKKRKSLHLDRYASDWIKTVDPAYRDNLTDRDGIHHRTGGRWFKDDEVTKHMGPGDHPSGTSQDVHGSGGGGSAPSTDPSTVPTFDPSQGDKFQAPQVTIDATDAWYEVMGLERPDIDFSTVTQDHEFQVKIADAYDAMPSYDKAAEASFQAMALETELQYRHLTEVMGVEMIVQDTDPYPDVHAMVRDVQENSRLRVMSTESTGGHPFFTNETNDKFRFVHDFFGHAATGRGFDRHGEEAAYLHHVAMYTPEARPAMTSETRGQNASLIKNGDFPEQKVALMPEWAWNDRIAKHGTHDQSTHGNWADGIIPVQYGQLSRWTNEEKRTTGIDDLWTAMGAPEYKYSGEHRLVPSYDEDFNPIIKVGKPNKFGNVDWEGSAPPEYLFRVVSNDDYERMKSQGFMDTHGEMNFGDEGMNASMDSTGTFYMPQSGTSRIVRIDYNPDDGWKVDPADGYVKTHSSVPFERVSLVSPVIDSRFVEEPHRMAETHPDLFGNKWSRSSQRFLLKPGEEPQSTEFLLTHGDVRRVKGDDFIGSFEKVEKHMGPGRHPSGSPQSVHGHGKDSFGPGDEEYMWLEAFESGRYDADKFDQMLADMEAEGNPAVVGTPWFNAVAYGVWKYKNDLAELTAAQRAAVEDYLSGNWLEKPSDWTNSHEAAKVVRDMYLEATPGEYENGEPMPYDSEWQERFHKYLIETGFFEGDPYDLPYEERSRMSRNYNPETERSEWQEHFRAWTKKVEERFVASQRVHLDRIAENSSVFVQADLDTAPLILKSGRFVSAFDEGALNAISGDDGSYREDYEARSFGVHSSHLPPDLRPVYGYLWDSDDPKGGVIGGGRYSLGDHRASIQSYGEMAFRLKDDAVRSRTSFVVNDSFAEQRYVFPTMLDDPGLEAASGFILHGFNKPSEYLQGSFQTTKYFEAQIHGGVTVDDIAEIILPYKDPDIEAEAKRLGIPVRYGELDRRLYTEDEIARWDGEVTS